jgi:hypothetical protein
MRKSRDEREMIWTLVRCRYPDTAASRRFGHHMFSWL